MKLVIKRRLVMLIRHMLFGHDHDMIVAIPPVFGLVPRMMIRIVMMYYSMSF